MRVELMLTSQERPLLLDVDFSSLDEFAEYLSNNKFFTARWKGRTMIYRCSIVNGATEAIKQEERSTECAVTVDHGGGDVFECSLETGHSGPHSGGQLW